jgi:hypothetical protein
MVVKVDVLDLAPFSVRGADRHADQSLDAMRHRSSPRIRCGDSVPEVQHRSAAVACQYATVLSGSDKSARRARMVSLPRDNRVLTHRLPRDLIGSGLRGGCSFDRRQGAAGSRPRRVEHQELRVTVSMGIGVYPADGAEAETLLANAGLRTVPRPRAAATISSSRRI